ncbi:MAG: restriction endonuclease subunit S [Anaerolineae bacterium]|nr:restriction endonuclease subunit S [Anaerolineae bacterium]
MPEAIASSRNMRATGEPWLGDIPIDWELMPAKRLFREISIKNHPDETLLSATQEYGVVPRDILPDRVVMPTGNLESFKLVTSGDFVISLRSFQGGIEYSEYRGLVSPAYTVIRPTKKINRRFFAYLMKSYPFILDLNKAITGIRDGKNISYKEFEKLILPIPPRAEQDGIVAFLDERLADIDRYIAAKQRLIELLNEQKAAIINRAVTRGLDPDAPLKESGIEWLGEIPVEWKMKKIGYIAKVGNGSTPNRSETQYWSDGTFPWLNSSSVNQGIITLADQFVTQKALVECHLPIVEPNSVLVAITGQGKTRGTAALVTFETTINQHIAYISLNSETISSEYLFALLRGLYSHLRYISDGHGGTRGALTCDDLKKLKIPVPPINQQKKILLQINQTTAQVDKAITETDREIELMQELRTALIAEAVTGKLDVSNQR